MPVLKNRKHELFCQEYMKDLNATRAYMRVYTNTKEATALANGSKLLGNVNINARVKELFEARKERVQKEADGTLDMLTRARDFNLCEYITDFGEIDIVKLKTAPIEIQRLLCNVKSSANGGAMVVNMEFLSKQFAIDKLGSHEGLWKNNHMIKIESYEDIMRKIKQGEQDE